MEANRITIAQKKHAPRSSPDLQSDHEKYIHFRALRTQALAETEHIRLAITKRSVIDRAEVEAEFARCARLVGAYLRRLAADAPCALVGQSEAEIDRWMQEAIRRPLESVKLDPEFLKPKKALQI